MMVLALFGLDRSTRREQGGLWGQQNHGGNRVQPTSHMDTKQKGEGVYKGGRAAGEQSDGTLAGTQHNS